MANFPASLQPLTEEQVIKDLPTSVVCDAVCKRKITNDFPLKQ